MDLALYMNVARTVSPPTGTEKAEKPFQTAPLFVTSKGPYHFGGQGENGLSFPECLENTWRLVSALSHHARFLWLCSGVLDLEVTAQPFSSAALTHDGHGTRIFEGWKERRGITG